MKYFYKNTRRAVSTIVEGAIFAVVLVAAFAAFLTFMNVNSEFLNSQLQLSQQEVGRIQEKFFIFSSDNGTGSNLRVDVENKGNGPLEVADLWIINKTASVCPPCESKLIEVDYADSFVSPKDTVNILANTPVSLAPGLYDLKVVSSLGNVETLSSLRTGGKLLSVVLYATPPQVQSASNTTLILNVFNNSTETIYNVRPNEPIVTPASALDDGGFVQKSPFSVEQLDPNESFTFTWNYELRGASGTTVEFTTNATGQRQFNSNPETREDITSHNANTTVILTKKQSTLTTTGEKAQVYTIIPSPAGKSNSVDSKGFWGVIVVNPTDQPMFVHRVEIGAYPNRQGSDVIFDEKFGTDEHVRHIEPSPIDCSTQTINDLLGNLTYLTKVEPCASYPLDNDIDVINNDDYSQTPDGKTDPIGNWDVVRDNNLVWTGNVTYPMMIPPYSAQDFMVKMSSEASGDISAFVVASSIQTSFGLFSNVGHASSAKQLAANAAIVNVYPTSSDVSGSGSQADAADDDFEGVKTITSGDLTTFYVTVREGQDLTSNFIDGVNNCNSLTTLEHATAANLTINLPPGFPDVSYSTSQTGFCTPVTKSFADGSKQIVAPIATNVGDETGTDVERVTFQFQLTAPEVTQRTIYVFFVYVTGFDNPNVSNLNNPLGPVSEAVVLIVKPAS